MSTGDGAVVGMAAHPNGIAETGNSRSRPGVVAGDRWIVTLQIVI
jgi:hypothetical protein